MNSNYGHPKRLNLMRLKTILTLMMALIATTTICIAKEPSGKGESQQVAATDTIMQKAVGDSIYRIITNAKKVEIAYLAPQSDSLRHPITRKVSSKSVVLMKFIATNPQNYRSDIAVYGEFMPQLQATYTQKKAKAILKYDFGLRKWGIFDSKDEQIAVFDLVSDNMLRFACQMFPDNQFFSDLLLKRL